MIPIYRAKKISSEEWVEGYLESHNSIFRVNCSYLSEDDKKIINKIAFYRERYDYTYRGASKLFYGVTTNKYSDEILSLENKLSKYGLNYLKRGLNYIKEQKFQIDPKTLSIHFQNMIDKNGKKVFASLDEIDSIGGDILDYKNIIVGYDPSNMMFNAQRDGYAIDMENLNRFKVIGIHEGE